MIGRFALDFVTVRRDGGWDPYAIEINLRKGGTTHPFLTLQFLTDGRYDPETAVFTAPSGRQKSFVASDHVENPSYRGLTPDDLFDVVARRGLHFDQSRQTGTVFHMLAGIAEHGRVGLTAVGDSQAEADEGLRADGRGARRGVRPPITPAYARRTNRDSPRTWPCARATRLGGRKSPRREG